MVMMICNHLSSRVGVHIPRGCVSVITPSLILPSSLFWRFSKTPSFSRAYTQLNTPPHKSAFPVYVHAFSAAPLTAAFPISAVDFIKCGRTYTHLPKVLDRPARAFHSAKEASPSARGSEKPEVIIRRYPPPGLLVLLAICGGAIGICAYDLLRCNCGSWDFAWDSTWLPESSSDNENTRSSEFGNENAPKPLTRQIILIRHGQYENVGASSDSLQGLTPLGRTQAAITGQRLKQLLAGKRVVGVHCSTMFRARETAAIIAHKMGLELCPEDPLLAEGVPIDPVPESRAFKPTEEEIAVDSVRIESAFRKYFYRPTCLPATATTTCNATDSYEILICHGNVIRYFFLRALQLPACAWLRLATYNCGITWLSVDSRGYVSARQFGDVGHLPPDMITYH